MLSDIYSNDLGKRVLISSDSIEECWNERPVVDAVKLFFAGDIDFNKIEKF